MADIHVKEPTNSLHKGMDLVVQKVAEQKDLADAIRAEGVKHGTDIAALEQQIATQEESTRTLLERMKIMDATQAKGSKVYMPQDGSTPGSETRGGIARWMLAGMGHALGGAAAVHSDEFDRALKQTASPTTNPSYGGYLVPDDFMQTIIRIVESHGLARRLCRVIPVPRERLYIPTHAAGPQVKWFAEGVGPTPPSGAADEHHVTLGRLTLTLYRMMALDTLTIEVSEESIPLIQDFLVDIFAETIAKEEDRVIFTGQNPANAADGNIVGVTTATGINTVYLGASSTSGNTAFNNLTYTDLVNTLDAPNEFVADNLTWLMSNSMVNHLRKLRSDKVSGEEIDGSGFPLWGEMTSGNPPQVLGRPYVRTSVMNKFSDDAVDTTMLCLGDFSYYLFGDGRQLEVAWSEHADFANGNIVMRVMERIGGVAAKADAFAILKTAAS